MTIPEALGTPVAGGDRRSNRGIDIARIVRIAAGSGIIARKIQCAFILKAATDAGRGRLTLLVRVKATIGSTFQGRHTPRIVPCARGSRKPVVENYHA